MPDDAVADASADADAEADASADEMTPGRYQRRRRR